MDAKKCSFVRTILLVGIRLRYQISAVPNHAQVDQWALGVYPDVIVHVW
jgi:hypothetical protein